VGVDEASSENVAAVATTNDFSDGQLLPELLEQIGEEIAQFSGDRAYDMRDGYQAIDQHHAQAAIPPRDNARIWQHGNSNDPPLAHDEKLRCIRRVGRKRWKQACGSYRRSLAKTAMFHIKMPFGDRVRARSFKGQAAEMLIRCAALNRITHLKVPDSYAV
jgi:hypothetical protein